MVEIKGGVKLSPRTGRPKADNPKNIRYSICIDSDTETRLQDYCLRFGVTKGEAIREAILLLLAADK